MVMPSDYRFGTEFRYPSAGISPLQVESIRSYTYSALGRKMLNIALTATTLNPMEREQCRRLTTFCLLSTFVLLLELRSSGTEPSATPDQDVQSTESKLTGGNSRAWIYQRIDKTMGASDECHQGKIYHFAANHTVINEHCVDGHVKSDTHAWHVEKSGPLDLVLRIDGQAFILLFKSESTGMLMKLRRFGTSKPDPTTDEEFRFESE
jgi:hypothetical protein